MTACQSELEFSFNLKAKAIGKSVKNTILNDALLARNKQVSSAYYDNLYSTLLIVKPVMLELLHIIFARTSTTWDKYISQHWTVLLYSMVSVKISGCVSIVHYIRLYVAIHSFNIVYKTYSKIHFL